MPKTFRDALQVTKALGYRYLWIDALCIIQDDLEDVGKEMARMGGIYRQSTLTILAANGPDTDSGLFFKRDARGSKPCNVQITLKRYNNYLRRHVSIETTRHFRHSALQTRGWVLQEEVLSGRLLTFNFDTVEWSCIKTFAHENRPCMTTFSAQKEVSETTFYRPNEAMRLIVRRPDIFNKVSQSGYAPERNDHFDTWYDMVAHYSQRALSVDSDKLLAIAGLASLMGKYYHLTYVTGLWKEDLQVGLCWWVTLRNNMFRRDGPRSITENFPDYLAPTWSWASAHGMCVRFNKSYLDRLPKEGLQVIDVEVSHLPGAPPAFGYIQFAKLSIRTKIRQVFLAPRQANPKQSVHPEVDDETDSLWVDAFDAITGSFVNLVCLDTVKVYQDILERYPGDRLLTKIQSAPKGPASETVRTHQLSSDGFEAWCVPCLVQKDHKRNREMIILVLTPLNAVAREYQRIGMMWISREEWNSNEACNRFMAGEDLHEDREIIHIL